MLDAACNVDVSRMDPAQLPARPAAELWNPAAPDRAEHAPDAQDVIDRLSHVGLSDPYSWARTPDELSEGQRHRLALADAIWQEADAIVADDWLTPLDPLTARAVAHRTAKACRDLGIGAILCTPTSAMLPDVQPDIWIHCGWQADPTVHRLPYESGPCTIVQEVTFERGTWSDWKALRHLHYAAGDPTFVRQVYALRHAGLDHPAAVAVLTYPPAWDSARNIATHDRYTEANGKQPLKRLNQEVAALARIVVAPELRGLGLAQMLIHGIAADTDARYIECQASMARFHPFLANCGFSRVCRPESKARRAWLDVVRYEQWDAVPPADADGLREAVDALPEKRRDRARRAVWDLYVSAVLYRRGRSLPSQRRPNTTDPRWPEAFDYALRNLADPPSYWIMGVTRNINDSAPTPQPPDPTQVTP
jgi:GNAT superfamily N-acetyltransferase